jgi:hypothetical protein
MNIRLVTLLCFALSAFALGQKSSNSRENILRDASRLAADLSSGDGNSAASMIYPKALSALGGPEKVAAVFAAGPEVAKEKGIAIRVSVPSAPEKVENVGPRLFAVIKINTHLETASGANDLTSYWLAVSDDVGANWTFVIFPNYSNAADDVKFLFPDGIGSLILPAASD